MTRREWITRSTWAFAPCALVASVTPVSSIVLDMVHREEHIQWPDADRPVSTGSLVKPFLTLAYARTHAQFPIVYCRGAADGCWLPRGHGRQSIVPALAHSCNVYFLSLARALDRSALDAVCLSFGLLPANSDLTPEEMIGLGRGWPQPPATLAKAFRLLVQDRSSAVVQTALRGMALCAAEGTAREVHLPCYAKTGTAACSHDAHRSHGDGYTVAAYPVDQPRLIVLAQHCGTTGAHTAADVGRILRSL